MLCTLLCTLILVFFIIARPALPVMRVILPLSTWHWTREHERIESLKWTDELYAQCITDSDACGDMTLVGNILPLAVDSALWFCLGGCIALAMNVRRKYRETKDMTRGDQCIKKKEGK